MKRILLVGLLAGIALAVIGAEPAKIIKATTEDGRHVILLPDGTWQFDKVSAISEQPSPVQPSLQKDSRQAAGPKTITLFFDAVKAGDLSKVQELNAKYTGLISAKFQTNDEWEKGHMPYMPLHCAAMEGNIKVAEFLLNNGADVNAKDETYRVTPLHFAAGYGHKDMAELLIARGAKVDAKASDGGTPLHNAASGGYKEVVELLLAKGAEVNSRDTWGFTPLHYAADHNWNEVVDLLKRHGGTE